MDTPDKIYIADHNANVETGYFSRNKDEVFTQEYIRKNALLEWAKETYLSENASAIHKVCYKRGQQVLGKV